ncbi:hypothetical protein BOTCAL_0287g00080 [Botryotinia calthae]|uniref:Uncharacterized protein n=1 Tax=Botryotinia calthae TaxID=38488 RepID=A0A4Y8CVL0_9HELO|nr:hypothetical protein BOTCAL_0287g00080 [Botryotinia calthae]
MSFPLKEVWSELLRSTSNNEAVLKELLEGRPEIERATDLNCLFMNYISIIYKVFNIKIEGGQIDPRVWLPNDHEFIEMLKLLVRYINDIITWIEDHDRTGAPWTSIGELHAESLFEVDAQCQKWWVLADMTIFNPATTPFKILPPMPLNEESVLGEFNAAIFNRFKGAPSMAPIESSPIDISTFEAPPSPASSLIRRQIQYSDSSSFNQQSTMLSLDKGQTAFEFADRWNHGGDSSFPPEDSYGDIDRGLLCNGGVEPEGLAVRHTPVFMPPTPRLDQNGFVPSPNPNLSFHTPVNKQDGFCQPMPPPARKIAIPRLQKQGTFEPLFPQTQNSELRPSLPPPQTFTSGALRKRGYAKFSRQALNDKPQKRRVVVGEMPQHNAEYTGMQEFSPGAKLPPDSLVYGFPGSNSGFSNGSCDTNHSVSTAFSPVKRNGKTLRTNLDSISHKAAIGSKMDWSSTVSTENSPERKAGNIVTRQQDWNDAVLAGFDLEQGATNTGLGIARPKISRDPSNLPGIPTMCTDMSIEYGRPATSQQPIYLSSPVHSTITGSHSSG